MRKSALLIAIIFAATAPTLASAKNAKHHVRHHAAAKAAAPSAFDQDPNTAFFRALEDLGASFGKVYPAKASTGAAE